MAHYLKFALPVAVALFASSGGAAAQRLPDPTLPPAELGTTGMGASAASSPLQSILISSGRKTAVINGQVVPLGGKYGDARLVRIAPTEITLQTEQTTEVLKLYPGVEKTPVQPAKQQKSGRPTTGQNRGE